MTEQWRPIEAFANYEVSNLGRVRSLDHMGRCGDGMKLYKGKVLKQQNAYKGYLGVCIKDRGNIIVHREVAKAFVPGYFDGAQVNHKDENKHNNRADNLEWVTLKENINYGSHNKKIKDYATRMRGCAVEQYSADGHLICTYPSQSSAAMALGVCLSRVQAVLDKPNKVKGYILKNGSTAGNGSGNGGNQGDPNGGND